MLRPDSSALVSTAWLAEHLDAPDVRLVDASYYLPGEEGDARADYEGEHIPGAVFFDIDEIKDETSPLPHMLPSPEKFASRVRKLGLGDGNRIVVYDRHGLRSAPRVWWSFRIMGHRDVAVLDGGLPKWKAEGRPLDDRPVQPPERHFTARFDRTQVRGKDQLLRNLETAREQVVDARARQRFEGAAGEIWPGRRLGRIPQSLNLPFTDLIDPTDGTLLPEPQLRERFAEAGLDLGKPVVTTCGSGVTACILALGLALVGHRDVAVYDGSWAEWGLPDAETPVASGAGDGEAGAKA
ncbi:3-mercaptopyruvate sulfurtransferase [Algihabitans albus]|uniref:3-mercaptopyruvate sulfurtransferase n=1 Tax=Algihabitans albus TaxID=2164067 RepID=UPI000E5D8646|nr:3-mercaptopyruvate sulfurtransferase [Algihabitans albus]